MQAFYENLKRFGLAASLAAVAFAASPATAGPLTHILKDTATATRSAADCLRPSNLSRLATVVARTASEAGVTGPSLERRLDEITALQRSINERPHILMAAMEFGVLPHLKGPDSLPVAARVGGEAAVVNDLLTELPAFLSKHGGGEVSAVFMKYKGMPTEGLDFVGTVDARVDGQIHQVRVLHSQHPSGANLYFLEHPWFERRSIEANQGEKNLYTDQSPNTFPQGEPGVPAWAGTWDEARSYSLFNQAIAAVADMRGANIYHGHDYHTALAPFYRKRDGVSLLSIHNGGYQGIFRTPGYGETRVASEHYPYGVPAGDYTRNNQLLSIFDIDFETYMRYFEHDGGLNMLKAGARRIEESNLIAGVPVSRGYEQDLRLSRADVLANIERQKGSGAVRPLDVYVPNGDVQLGLLDGIENGMSSHEQAATNPALRRVSDDRQFMGLIKHLEVQAAFRAQDLNFGSDLTTAQGIAVTLKGKARLKRLLQLEAFGRTSPEKPVYAVLARLVDQKNIGAFAENIEHVVASGGQVIVGGLPGDEAGRKVAARLIELEQRYPESVRYFHDFVRGPLAGLMKGGSDFNVIPSKFEPCGLTDIEFCWTGSVAIVRKTGGLGKVRGHVTYEFLDDTDPVGEQRALRGAIDESLALYKDKADLQKRVIDGMRADFSWDRALWRYAESYRSATLYQYLHVLDQGIASGEISSEAAIADATAFVKSQSTSARTNLMRLIRKKSGRTAVEEGLLQAEIRVKP